MKKQRPRNYEDDYYESNILGTGQYQSIPYKPGKPKHNRVIGFVKHEREMPQKIKVVSKYSRINLKDY